MELENMLTLIKAVSDSELTHFSLETEEMKLTLEKKEIILVHIPPSAHSPLK